MNPAQRIIFPVNEFWSAQRFIAQESQRVQVQVAQNSTRRIKNVVLPACCLCFTGLPPPTSPRVWRARGPSVREAGHSDSEFISESRSVTVTKSHNIHELTQTGKKREEVQRRRQMESCACLCTTSLIGRVRLMQNSQLAPSALSPGAKADAPGNQVPLRHVPRRWGGR
jgi:hypothetical protein